MHKPNFTAQLTNKEAALEAASEIGCVQTRGPQKGAGSIREMLENISQGDVLVMFHDYDEPHRMIEAAAKIRALAEPLDQYTGDTLRALAAALENAAKRKD
jgi:hypothetical protein